jgi:RNA recognition motif-containing protein
MTSSSSSSWTQVYITGLSRSIHPTDDTIESMLDERYQLLSPVVSSSCCGGWAGYGTTIIKRDTEGKCRGFAFVSFHSNESATMFVDRVNNYYSNSNINKNNNHTVLDEEQGHATRITVDNDDGLLPSHLHAEMSTPGKKSNKNNTSDATAKSNDLPDLRLRRQRKQPVRKHPVIISSNGKRTNLSNSNKSAG